ncbi:MAG: hypothetical protein Q7K43_01705, partial [Candidatus Woesearchaeota archaeon]|nr:hypothetical protein [Candidatus Woesearchaeota archaeon]
QLVQTVQENSVLEGHLLYQAAAKVPTGKGLLLDYGIEQPDGEAVVRLNTLLQNRLTGLMKLRWAYETKDPKIVAQVLHETGVRDRPFGQIDHQKLRLHLEGDGKDYKAIDYAKLFSGVFKSDEDQWGLVAATAKGEGSEFLDKLMLANAGPFYTTPPLQKILSRYVKKDGTQPQNVPESLYALMKSAMDGTVYLTMGLQPCKKGLEVTDEDFGVTIPTPK